MNPKTPLVTSTTVPIPHLKATPQTRADLQHLSDLLHLLHHRNHNQHRRSPWYRHFSTFRRHLSHLLVHLDVLAEQPTTHLGRHRKKATDAKVQVLVQQELAFWRDVAAAKWWRGFSQVVADGRFAVLGVVLLAVLSEVCRKVGLVGVFEAIGEKEVRKVLERFAEEEFGVGEAAGGVEGMRVAREEDVGEVLRRDDDLANGDDDLRDLEQDVRRGERSACMAPEQDVLKQSREALQMGSISAPPAERMKPASRPSSPIPAKTEIHRKQLESKLRKATMDSDLEVSNKRRTKREEFVSKTEKKRPAKDKLPGSAKPVKKKKKKNAIDDLFSGL